MDVSESSEQKEQSFEEVADCINELLEGDALDTAHAVGMADSLTREYPVPYVEIVPRQFWGPLCHEVVIRTHAESDINVAKRNLSIAGQQIHNINEEGLLTAITAHWCGWSPTDSRHLHDAWVSFLRRNYPQKKDLVPILDSLIWEDEIQRYPHDLDPGEPTLFLLANDEAFYVYNFETQCLIYFGRTLHVVRENLRRHIWEATRGILVLRPLTDETPRDYFPVYSRPDTNRVPRLVRPLRNIP
jgi:hypothetical protein